MHESIIIFIGTIKCALGLKVIKHPYLKKRTSVKVPKEKNRFTDSRNDERYIYCYLESGAEV